jgi:hypothetical protein
MNAEASAIRRVLLDHIPVVWDGKKCILELKKAAYNWKQMEWIGWYFEYAAKQVLVQELGGSDGPAFGNTKIDYRRGYCWDLKAHVLNSGNPWAVLNDKEAIDNCIVTYGAVGFVIACGIAEYDSEGEFKAWHDALKGKVSKYEQERIRRGAPSRRRKTSFQLSEYTLIGFRSLDEIERARQEGWLGGFQEGMRNADGSPRRAKYKIKICEIPSRRRLC